MGILQVHFFFFFFNIQVDDAHLEWKAKPRTSKWKLLPHTGLIHQEAKELPVQEKVWHMSSKHRVHTQLSAAGK